MGEYQVTVYAGDSWQEHYVLEQKTATTRGESLTSRVDFGFTTSHPNYDYGSNTMDFCRFRYALPTQYKKKRLSLIRQYAYVSGYSSSASGALAEGSFVFNCDGQMNLSFRINDYAFRPLSGLGKNAYNQITEDPFQYAGKTFQEGYWVGGAGVTAGTTGYLKAYTSYTAKGSYTYQSHTGANPPYAVFTYEDVTPWVENCAPKSGFMDENVENTFRWSFRYFKSQGIEQTIHQKAYQFRWRVKDAETYSEVTVETDRPSHTVAANTFPVNGVFEWCVRVQSDDEIWGNWTSWMPITTVDSAPSTTIRYPIDTYIDGAKENLFQWNHLIPTGSPQTQFDLQYKTETSESWIDLKTAQTAEQSTTIPENTFSAGRMWWRARTYNTDGICGEWSLGAEVIVKAAPEDPILIVVQEKARPLFSWQSAGQTSFCLTVYQDTLPVYATGEIPGSDKSYRVSEYLPNGTYTACLWVKNQYDLQSNPVLVGFTVYEDPLAAPILTAEQSGNGAKVTVTGSGFAKYYIFRDGIPVHKLTAAGTWMDYSACGTHVYYARGVTGNDSYADSNAAQVTILVEYAQLSLADDLQHPLPLKIRRGESPVIDGTVKTTSQSLVFAGRTYPIYEFSENLSEPVNLQFSFRTRAEFQKLVQLIRTRRPMLYRDYRGERVFMAILSVDYTVSPVSYDFSIAGERVDYVEKIEYDLPEVNS